MKILVAVKQVPDTATQVKVSADPRAIDTTGITWIVSPYDEFAVEEALRIKEKRGQGEVVAVSLGPERVSFDAAGAPVVFDRVFIPGDRFRITRELHYEGAAS